MKTISTHRTSWTSLLAAAALAVAGAPVWAQSSVTHGRITAVTMVTQDSTRAQTGGALVGGALGIASGSGQSGSNRALRGVAGGFAGQQVGRIASQRQAFEYTILVGGSTITMVTDEAGLRVGDCVAVERGSFNNLRLVADSMCAPARAPQAQAKAAPPAAPKATPADVSQANACVQAKNQLLAAETEQAFDLAERRVRLLCAD